MLRKTRQFEPNNAAPGGGWRATSRQPGQDLRAARESATIRLKFNAHPGNPSLTHRGVVFD